MGVSLEKTNSDPQGGGSEDQGRALWGAVLVSLARAVQAARLYDPRHALVEKSLDEALSHWRAATPAEGTGFVGVGTRCFLFQGEVMDLGEGVAAMADTLHRRDIAGVEFRVPQTREELEALLRWVLQMDDRGAAPAEPPGWVHVVRVCDHALGFRSQAGGGSAGWAAVLQSIAAGAAGDESGRVLAASIERVTSELTAASPEQRARAEVVLADMARHGVTPGAGAPNDNVATSVRIGEVLAHLSPELRATLLQIGCVRTPGWVARHVDELPMAELTAALMRLDQGVGRMPAATMMLLSKLVGLTTLSTEAREQITGMAARRARDGADGVEQPGTVEELLTNRQVQDFCQDDYRATLDAAAGTMHAAVLMPLAMSDLSDVNQMQRCIDIGCWLLGDAPQLGLDQEGPIAWTARHVAETARAGRFELIWSAIDAAAVGDSAASQAASRLLRERITERPAMDLVAASVHTAADGGGIRRLLAAAPETLLSCLMARVQSGRQSPSHAHVREVIAAAPIESVRSAMVDLARDESEETIITALCGHMPVDRLATIGAVLLGPERPTRVRAGVARILDERVSAWPAEIMRVVLDDADPQISQRAFLRIANRADAADVGTLAHALRGGATGVVPSGNAASVLVHALGLHGSAGVAALIDVLEQFGRGVQRDRIRLCRRIALELESRRELPAVAKALKAWRRSVGHTVGLFIVEDVRSNAA